MGQLKRATVERPSQFCSRLLGIQTILTTHSITSYFPKLHKCSWALTGRFSQCFTAPAFALECWHAPSVQGLTLQSAAILLLLRTGQLLAFYYDFIFLVHHSKQTRVWSMAVSISASLQIYRRMPSSTPLIPESPVSASCWQQKYSSTAGLIQNSIFHHLQLPAGVQDVVRWLLSLSNSIRQYLSLAPSAEVIFAPAKAG